MHKSDRIEAGCTVEDEPYKLLARDAEKSILAGPLSSPSEQLPFSTSLKAPVPLTHDAVTVPVMFGPNISGSFTLQKAGEFDSAHGDILEGPFYRSSAKKGQFNNAAEWATEAPRVLFSASRSSSKYGNSTSVQPASIRLIHCIKS